MSDPNTTDRWTLLATEIGADVTSQDEQKPRPAPPAAPRPAVRTEPAPRAKKSASDWGQLAANLGVAVPPEPAKPPRSVPTTVAAPPKEKFAETTPLTEPVEPPRRERSRPRRAVEETVELDWSITSVAAQPPVDDSVQPTIAPAADDAVPTAEDPGEQKTGGRRRRRRRGGRKSGRGTAKTAETAADDLEPAEDEAKEIELTDQVASSASEDTAEEGDDSEEPKRGRSKRRRRRRRSGNRSKTAKAEGADPVDGGKTESDLVELVDELESKVTGDADESSASDDIHADDDEHAGEQQSSKSGARDIPSWQDAIGFIINANMEARAKSPRGNNGHRGRGRGQQNSRGRGDHNRSGEPR